MSVVVGGLWQIGRGVDLLPRSDGDACGPTSTFTKFAGSLKRESQMFKSGLTVQSLGSWHVASTASDGISFSTKYLRMAFPKTMAFVLRIDAFEFCARLTSACSIASLSWKYSM